MLTQLQHRGGKTNLIDFTRNILIALFFACDGHFEEEGRIICLEAPKEPSNKDKFKDITYEEGEKRTSSDD